MKCPKCQTDMNREFVRGVTLDRCTKCQGTLVDKTALVAIDSLDIGSTIESRMTLPDADIDSQAAHCHECNNPMIALRGAADIRFDWCDQCERTFFDKGELAAFDAFEDNG